VTAEPDLKLFFDGLELLSPESITLDNDLEIPADDWSVRVSAAKLKPVQLALLRAATQVTAMIGKERVLWGIVDRMSGSDTKSDRFVTVAGRDRAALLVDDQPDPTELSAQTLLKLAQTVAAPYAIPVKTSGRMPNVRMQARRSTSSSPLAQIVGQFSGPDTVAKVSYTRETFSVRSGQSAFEALDDVMQDYGLYLWFSPAGELIIGTLNLAAEPLFNLRYYPADDPRSVQNNVTGAWPEWNNAERISRITVRGSTEKIIFTATDPTAIALGINRSKQVTDHTVETVADAQRRAQRILSASRSHAARMRYRVKGFGQGDALYAPNSTVMVDDQVWGVSGLQFITARRFEQARGGGHASTLTVCPPEDLR